MCWRGTCDLGAGDDAIARTGPRAPWRPHFLYDDAARIDIPALRFFAPRIESRSVDLRRLDRLARIAASDHCGDQVARDYFIALATDEERVGAIRQMLTLQTHSGGNDMRNRFTAGLSGLALLLAAGCVAVQPLPGAPGDDAGVVHVAPPTGERTTDRASILAALDEVEPGGTIQFAAGTYLIGEIISVTVPHITLLGHPDGTSLRGCDPAEFVDRQFVRENCNGLELAGGHQTVRDFTFEYAHWALHLGCCQGERALLRAPDGSLVEGPAIYRTEGGHLVERNVFRRSLSGIRMYGDWTEPAIVRNNRFVDNWHSVSINGNTVHLLDNDFSVPEPERVPFYGFPWDAVKIGPPLPLQETDETLVRACAHNIVAGNRIDGSPDGIRIEIYEPGTSCRRNVIRDNTITVRRVRAPAPERWFTLSDESDPTFVGIPVALLNYPEAFGQNEPGRESFLEDNLIEGNRIIGADGLGFEVLHASRNRIVNNTISRIAERDPFPGNALGPRGETGALEWREADGAGIWLSPGSDENEIAGNIFEDVASYAIVLEGDRNSVDVRSVDDTVRDLGSGNRVSSPDTPTSSPAYESRFIDAGGVRLQYLEFGGEGLPILFTAGSRSAETWAGFAPRFTDRHRVLAITDRGVPPSEGEESGFTRRAGDILALLDTLGIERAVLVANAYPARTLVHLAEHHPERLAGLVFLAPESQAGIETVEDPSGAMLIIGRGFLSTQGRDPDTAGQWDEEDLYLPAYLEADTATIAIPALTFVNLEGTRGLERSYYPLEVAELVASGALAVPDSAARTYFERLATDEAMEAEVRAAWDGTFVPVFRANERAFFRAFGNHLRVVRLDVPLMNGVPVVTGYEYRDAPELIEPHIRRFLTDIEPIAAGSQDTIRYTVLVAGQPAGERLSWAESPGIWRYSARGPPSGFRRTSRIVLDAEGLPRQMEISGRKNPMETWEERFHLDAGRATWSTPVDQGELSLSGPTYYAAIHPAHDLGVLARALFRAPAGVLSLLPAGEARLEPLETRVVEVDGRDRTIRLYAIHGLDLRPRYLWLDEVEATFADEWSVLAGWEAVFPALRAAIAGAIAEHMRSMAGDLAPPARERPLVIRGARLFDPETHAVHSGTTIIVEGNRVLAVGPDGTVDIPADAEVVHAEGRMVLPGLWDMHAHQDSDRYLEWYVPLHLAAGVTTTRDMGSDASMLVSLRQRIDAGEVIGPRIIMAGFIEGIGGSRTGIQVENAADAQAAVDRYAGLGFVQLKIYNRVPAHLVPVAIERAKHHGMRVSGHIPWDMTGREAVESGFDEIQHMTSLMEGMVLDPNEDVTDSDIANALAGLTPESELVREFIGLLAANDVAVDPTLAFFHSTGAVPPTWIEDVLDRLPPQARRRWLDRSAPLWAGERWSEILANQFGIVRALHQAGVPILPGTDMVPGFGLHKELELYVEAGIPAPEVLTLATLGAARVMGMDAELGSIEPGKLADLILVDGDPTTDISDIRRVVLVVKDGRSYDPAAIYRALRIETSCENAQREGDER
jgi:pimeloyl-ACP methyl ester carboxylesterase